MKKLLIGSLILTLPLCLLTSCDEINFGSNAGSSSNDVKERQTMITLSALGGTSLLDSQSNISTRNNDILTSIEMFSSLLIKQNVTSVENLISDNSEYDKKMIISSDTMLDGKKEIILYYNETIEDEDFDEIEYRLDGIAIEGDKTYTLKGESELEDGEEELEFTLTESRGNYVVISQEKELDEEEFEYKLYQNGRRVFTQSIEMEVERGYTYIEFKETSSSTRVKFEIKLTDIIYVKYNNKVYELNEVTNSDGNTTLVLNESNKTVNEIFGRIDD